MIGVIVFVVRCCVLYFDVGFLGWVVLGCIIDGFMVSVVVV